ncbi:hypothetical protein BDW72DRAFT_194417 [Aspergillus terricola var. indicus]
MTPRKVNKVDARSWAAARYLHRDGFITLVTPRRPFVPRCVDKRLKSGRRRTPSLVNYDYGYRVNIADMHRMYMRYLQAKLIRAAIALHFNKGSEIRKSETDVLEFTLRKYVQAIQDREERDEPTGELPSDFEDLKANARPTGPWESGNDNIAQPLYTTRAEILKRGLLSRFAGALVGGVFLVGPMWLFALERDLYLQLGFTTGFVSVFGFLMAWLLGTPENVFTASTAYTAVLMVFVGVIMQEEGS